MIIIFIKKYKWYTKKKYQELAYITNSTENALYIAEHLKRNAEITDMQNTYCGYTPTIELLEKMGYIDRGFNIYERKKNI